MPNCKYIKQQEIVSYNGGVDWQDVMPAQYRKGQLIEHDSEDCTDMDTIYRWRKLTGVYLCVDDVKYEKLILDESYDGGLSWYPAYPSQYTTGEEIGVDENYCNDKFVGHYILTDDDVHHDCPPGYRWNGFECVYVDPIKVVKCDGNPELTRTDTAYYSSYSSSYWFILRSAEIGKCVTSIAASAFTNSSAMTYVSMADSVTTIGEYAFRGCTSLSGMNTTTPGELNIPSGVTSIGDRAFYNCSGITSIICNPTTPPSIGYNAFYGTNNCQIYVPCGSYGAYQDSWSSLADRLAPLGGEVCVPIKISYNYNGGSYTCYCGGDTNVSSANTNGTGAARSAITGVSIGDCVTGIGATSLSGCGFTSITIPSGVTSIGDYAFNGCTSLASLVIPSSVTNIGDYAFKGCTSLRGGLSIPSGITSINNGVFSGCTSLTNVTIPDTVTTIGDYAFGDDYNLTSITINAVIPPAIGNYSFYVVYNTKIYVPCDSVYDYKAASGWSGYSSIIEAIPGSCHIGKWKARYQDSHIESAECDSSSAITYGEITSPNVMVVEIGDCVKWIATSAFNGYTSLTNVTIGSGVTDIYDEAFSGCTSLSSCTMGSGVTSIGNSAFRSCSSLRSITIPSGTTSIGDRAFDGTGVLNVYVKATTPPTAGEYIFGSTYSSSLRIHIPSGTLNVYKNANGWSTYKNYLTTS